MIDGLSLSVPQPIVSRKQQHMIIVTRREFELIIIFDLHRITSNSVKAFHIKYNQ